MLFTATVCCFCSYHEYSVKYYGFRQAISSPTLVNVRHFVLLELSNCLTADGQDMPSSGRLSFDRLQYCIDGRLVSSEGVFFLKKNTLKNHYSLAVIPTIRDVLNAQKFELSTVSFWADGTHSPTPSRQLDLGRRQRRCDRLS